MATTLPHDIIEDILELLPVNTLLRFKSVCKRWKFTIESQRFKDRHMNRGQSLEDPDILLLDSWNPSNPSIEASLVTLTFDTWITPVSYKTQTIPVKSKFYKITHSCDGLVCMYDLEKLMCVMNPATRWQRSLPQPLVLERYNYLGKCIHEFPSLGFGKDNIRSIYKMVWLYTLNGSNQSTCELFSFATNTWRILRITPYFQILCSQRPVYVNGSLYWFIYGNQERGTTVEILSFDLHAEGCTTMSQTPVAQTHQRSIILSSLNNQLCVSVQTWTSKELDIWLFNPYQTWQHAYRIDYPCGVAWFGVQIWSITPIAVLGENKKKKKKKLLVYDWNTNTAGLVLFDIFPSQTTFAKKILSFRNGQTPTAYIPSLITI